VLIYYTRINNYIIDIYFGEFPKSTKQTVYLSLYVGRRVLIAYNSDVKRLLPAIAYHGKLISIRRVYSLLIKETRIVDNGNIPTVFNSTNKVCL